MNEISDYLRPAKVVWALVAIAVVAAATAAAFMVLPVDPEYKTVAVVGPDNESQSANDRIDFIRNLQAAAETATVLDTVAEQSGLTRDQLEAGLRVKRIESSNLVQISYFSNDQDAEAATIVVLTLPDAAVEFLRLSQIAEATGALDEATTQLNTATELVEETAAEVEVTEAAVVAAVVANDNIRPDVTSAALQNEIAALRIRRATTDAEEEPVLAEQLDSAIATLEAQLPAAAIRANLFAALVAEEAAAVRANDEAVRAQESAASDLEDAEGAYELATTLPTVTLQVVEKEFGQLFPGLRQVAAVGVAAGMIVIAIAIGWNIVFGRRKVQNRETSLLADDVDVFAKTQAQTAAGASQGAPATAPAKPSRSKIAQPGPESDPDSI